ncbi:hypothetical protein VaNZ11_016318, partial [Volvox africanus]
HQVSRTALEAAGSGAGGEHFSEIPDPESVATREDALVDLRDQVLTWLALCHQGAGDPEASLACVRALREAGSALGEGPDMAALETRALAAIASNSVEEVVAAAAALAVRPDAHVAVVWETLRALLTNPRVGMT